MLGNRKPHTGTLWLVRRCDTKACQRVWCNKIYICTSSTLADCLSNRFLIRRSLTEPSLFFFFFRIHCILYFYIRLLFLFCLRIKKYENSFGTLQQLRLWNQASICCEMKFSYLIFFPPHISSLFDCLLKISQRCLSVMSLSHTCNTTYDQ